MAILLFSSSFSQGQIKITNDVTTDPAAAKFVYDDVHNFIRLEKGLTPENDVEAVLKAEYFSRGTVGLDMFVEKYALTPKMLAKSMKKRSAKYGSLDELPQWLIEQEKFIREAFVKLKKLAPQVVFPPTYFLVGAYRGIGSGSPEGQLITVEKFDPSKKDLKKLIVHELTHFQQLRATGPDEFYALFNEKKSLLGLTIREGAAEFFADYATGDITQNEARRFVMEHEKELWDRFKKDMLGSETGDWMWSKPKDPNQPRHVAYVIGCRIVKAYYNRAEDKTKAIDEILSVTDYPAFLERSGYSEKFED